MAQALASKRKLPVLFFSFFSLLTAVISLLSVIRYETNDDIGFILLASGRYTGQPEPNLVFIGIPMGYLISSLYRVLPQLEWYTATLVGLQILSFTVLTTAGLQDWRDRRFISIIYLLVVSSFQVLLLAKLQFTTTAAITATAGLLCLIKSSSYLSLSSALGFTLVFAGVSLRFESAALALIVGFPFLLFSGPTSSTFDKTVFLRRLTLLVFSAGLAIGANKLCNRHYQLDPAWQNYTQYNSVRGRLHARDLAENFEPKAVTKRNYQLLRHFMQDPALSTQQLEALEAELGDDSAWTFDSSSAKLRPYLPIIITAIALLACLAASSGPKFQLTLGLVGLIFVGVMVLLTFGLIFKERVFLSALFPCVILPISLWLSTSATLRKFVVFGLILSLGCIGLYTTGSALKTMMGHRAESQLWGRTTWTSLQTFFKNDERSALMLAGSLALENLDPWRVSSSIPPRRLVAAGWLTGSPYNLGRYDSFPQAAKNMVFLSNKDQMTTVVPYVLSALRDSDERLSLHPIASSSDNLIILEAILSNTKAEPATLRQGKAR